MTANTIIHYDIDDMIDGPHLIIEASGLRGIIDDPSTTIVQTIYAPIIIDLPKPSIVKTPQSPIPHQLEKINHDTQHNLHSSKESPTTRPQ